MTLPEPDKLADFDFDWKFENWSENDPPYPPKREFNPLMGEIFFRGWYENLIGLGLFIRLSYNPSWWEKSAHLDFGAPRGVKVGVIGGSWGSKIKYGSKCLKLPNSSRKVVFSILKFFHLICKILRKISTLHNFQSKSKSASLSGSGKVIGFVQNHLNNHQNLILYLCWKPGT